MRARAFMGPGRYVIVLAAVAAACTGAQRGNRDTRTGQVKSPGVTLQHGVAEGSGDPDSPEVVDAGADGSVPEAAPTGPPVHGYFPDPTPLRMARQWEYRLQHRDGKVSVASVREQIYRQPVVTARHVGRYAIELWIGRELIDRVRFDFPMLAGEQPRQGKRRPLNEPPTLAPGAMVFRSVRVPASPRATRAVLVDRATGVERLLKWPPDQPPVRAQPARTPSPDAGPDPADSGASHKH